ncbi:Protein phosphatase PTC7 like protein [Tritrichomonas foetus]|uniref:Protein phosphatase n=1 Tax=Tritrichomonas foetus TaxID=1144522 RepID=A0A1J4JY01_9EUKA|nr:Protein phosphatase PTC7 like protein [Tritrichomonas foetus]|eukprot:OHT02412.1 Protein phosphatase PTC7 like protein [Tritrichomonas foetus]
MLSNSKNNKINSFARFLKIISKACLIPHPEKAHFGGEDYYFISKNNTTIGVADGVGGWADHPGASSTKYSHDLMNFCNECSYITDPLLILQTAYEKLDFSIKGSTTALVAQVCDKSLHVCNVGDSALSVYRKNKRVFQTTDTLHGFNFPYQLGSAKRDNPSDGTYDIVPIQPGDVIVAGSDGLWDNVWNNDIEKHIEKVVIDSNSKHEMMQKLADLLGNDAHKNGKDRLFNSPFAQDALNHGYRYIGGKLDDVTVVASIVVEDEKVNE